MHSERLHSSFHWSGGSLKKEKCLFWGRRNFPSFLVSHVCSSPQQILTRLVTAVMGSLNHGKSVKRLIQLSHRHQKSLFVFVEMSFKYQKKSQAFYDLNWNQTVTTTADKLPIRIHNSCSLPFNKHSTPKGQEDLRAWTHTHTDSRPHTVDLFLTNMLW